MNDRGRAASLWLPPIAVMALIFALSSMPSEDVDRTAIEVALRKAAHFVEYAVLAALWLRALRPRLDLRIAIGLAFGLTLAYAVSDQLHQTLVDGRVASPFDVMIDAAGAAAALALMARRRVASRA